MAIELNQRFKQNRERVGGIINNVATKYNISLTQVTIDNLIIHLSLSLARLVNGTYIPTSESQIHNLIHHEYYGAAKEIIKALEEEFNVSMDINDIAYTTMYLANINLLDMDFNYEFDLFDDDLENIIADTIIQIQQKLHINLKDKAEFYAGMTLHFYPALERLQNDCQLIDNPLVERIQNEHHDAYACALIFNEVVKAHYNKTFNEHELAYIALHFGTAI